MVPTRGYEDQQPRSLDAGVLREAENLEWLFLLVDSRDKENHALFRALREVVATLLPKLRTLELAGFGPLRVARDRESALRMIDNILTEAGQ